MSSVFVPVCRLTIGKLVVNAATNIRIIESLEELTTTCDIQLPKAIVVRDGNLAKRKLEDYITPGQKIKVELGYNGSLHTEFIGYVSRGVKTTIPLEITCEDDMYMLKRTTVPAKVWSNAKLEEVLKHIAPSYSINALDISLGKFSIGLQGKPTAAEVLDALKNEFGIQCFFRYENEKPVLVAGKPNLWTLEAVKTTYPIAAYYHLQRNVADFGNLEYVNSDDKKIRIDYKSRLSNGKVISSTFTGDSEGETRNVTFVGLSQLQLDQWAKEDYAKAKIDGYKGAITAFGIPVCRAGQSCTLVDQVYEARKSTHIVNRVEIEWGMGGFRRTVTLGRKLA